MQDFLSRIPIIGGFFDDSDEQMKRYIDKIMAEYEGFELPDVSWQNLSPEMYDFQYLPESAKAEIVQEDPRFMRMQQDYLNRLQGLAQTGLGAEDEAVFDRARDLAASEAQSQRQALMRDAEARGTMGGGLSFISQQMANQSSADRLQDAALDRAAQAARQRALYEQAYGSELGQQSNRDLERRSFNADILNRFNELNTGARNQAAQMRAGVGMANTDLRNQYNLLNQQQRLGQRQMDLGNRQWLADRRTGAMDDMARYYSSLGDSRRGSRAAIGSGIGAGLGYAFGGPAGGRIGGAIGGGLGGL